MSYHDMVEGLLGGRLGNSAVIRVDVHEDEGWDGGPIIGVTVVWDDATSSFDVDSAMDFRRALHEKLDEDAKNPFPVVSFLAKSEDSAAA